MTKKSSSSSKRRRSASSRPSAPPLQPTHILWALGLLCLAIAILTGVGLFTEDRGVVVVWWLTLLQRGFGWGAYLFPLWLALLGAWIISQAVSRPLRVGWLRTVSLLVLTFCVLALSHLFSDEPLEAAAAGAGGGYAGYWISHALSQALGWLGCAVVLVMLCLLALLFVFNVSLDEVVRDLVALLGRLRTWLQDRIAAGRTRRQTRRARRQAAKQGRQLPLPEPDMSEDPLPPPVVAQPIAPQVAAKAPTQAPVFRDAQPPAGESPTPIAWQPWVMPRIDEMLAERSESATSVSDIRNNARVIEDTLRSLGVPVTVVEVNPGPVVTQYGLEPGYTERKDRNGNVRRVKVKVSRISALAQDLALALAASPIRIEAPVPGKGIVGLEVPNLQADVVGLRSVMTSDAFAEVGEPLTVALGRDVSGGAIVDDLATLPHLLIAGATGSGKSVCINALIACLLLRNSPDDLRLLMVDPKRVELSLYNGIPHLLAPVVVEAQRVVGVLNWLTREMERRYKQLSQMGVRNVTRYNERVALTGDTKMPNIVVFIDELADLMMVAPDKVEPSICRLAQMARATGIHLVIATQRPSVDVVTGLIKANFPARLAFAVTSQTDSRVILDVPGADKLLGKGDGLYMAPDSPKLERIQGCWVLDQELVRLVAFWKRQAEGRAAMDPVNLDEPAPDGSRLVQKAMWPDMAIPEEPEDDRDPMLAQARDLVIAGQRASVSWLQRRLRIGYTRAARLIDMLEEDGVIGPATGSSKPREVYHQPPSQETPPEGEGQPPAQA